MLGIGITTRNRARIHMYQRGWVEQFCPRDTRIVVIDDNSDFRTPEAIWSPRRLGVAQAKTACLWRLQQCDPVILLDDDIWPICSDWLPLLIGAAAAAHVEHLIYIPQDARIDYPWDASFCQTGKHTYGAYTLLTYAQCSGVLMFMTQHAVQTVGAFGRYPGVYGFEHAGYSQRIYKAGLMGDLAPYTTVQGLKECLWALDFDGAPPNLNYPMHSSLDFAEAQAAVTKNGHYMQADIGHVYQPLYDPLERV